MDYNEVILNKLHSEIPGLEIDVLDLGSSSLHVILSRVGIKLSKNKFTLFQNYMCKHKDIFFSLNYHFIDLLFCYQYSMYVDEKQNKILQEKRKQLDDQLKRSNQKNILSDILNGDIEILKSFDKVVEYVKDFIDDTELANFTKKYKNRRLTRNSNVTSSTSIKSSALGDNNMNNFRFDRMSKPSAKKMTKIKFNETQLTEIIIEQHFNGRSEDYTKYMETAKDYLNVFRAIFECHFEYHSFSVQEVQEFQPLFQCFLRQIISTLDTVATTTSSSSSSTSFNSQKFQVEMANRNPLSFKAKVFIGDNLVNEVEETINGFTDLIVSVGPHNSLTWDSVRFLIELKPPPAFAKNSDFDGPKNQVFAELLGFKTMLDNNNNNKKKKNKKIIVKGCLTDGFAIYICFLYGGIYYISLHTAEPDDYVNALLFLLCNISASELDKLIKSSEVIPENSSGCNNDDSKANKNNKDNNQNKRKMDPKNNDDKKSKRPMHVINFKYEDEVEQYQDQLDYITRLENKIQGYVHIDEENLQNCEPNNCQNPYDYVMSKFLNNP